MPVPPVALGRVEAEQVKNGPAQHVSSARTLAYPRVSLCVLGLRPLQHERAHPRRIDRGDESSVVRDDLEATDCDDLCRRALPLDAALGMSRKRRAVIWHSSPASLARSASGGG